MASYVILFCFLTASIVGTNAATLGQVEITDAADFKQRIIRSQEPEAPAATKEATATKTLGNVTIDLYYESRCPDCVEFINNTLAPLWRNADLRDHLTLTMNPYGNSMSIPVKNVSEGYRFFHPNTTGAGWDYVHICQHGTDECFGNLVHACALKSDEVHQSQAMELIFCMADDAMKEQPSGIEKASYECMAKAGIDQKPIKECVQSTHGNKLMTDFGKLTQKVPDRTGTPWVMLGGKNLVDASKLLKSVCHQLGNSPSSCSSFKDAPAADEAPAPAPAADEDSFTVLPLISKTKKWGASSSLSQDLVQVSLNMPKTV